MADAKTVYQVDRSGNFNTLKLEQGVVTLFGYGIKVRVERGHLILCDGIGTDRHHARLPRVGHGLRRLVVIGSDGIVSLAALRWLADQDASFVMLDRDGSVLATTGPVRSSDARLRRAQALAHHSGAALEVARKLITWKLAGQEQVVRQKLLDRATGDMISQYAQALPNADTLDGIRLIESRGAAAYWAAWKDLPIMFPKKDLARVPEHWRVFNTRKSPLSGSPRLATNPANAILNYLYAVLESEARLAAAALGLDPGLGFLHVDTPARDSLACDLMEVVRPQVDGYLLDWITRTPLKRDWFFEQRDGNCRLMGSFAVQLSQTAPIWGRAVAPIAEWVARLLWTRRPAPDFGPATRLTQCRRHKVRDRPAVTAVQAAHRPQSICLVCGTVIPPRRKYCTSCAAEVSTERLLGVAKIGRGAAHSSAAEERRAGTQRRQAVARWRWEPAGMPAWLNEETYSQHIQPKLAGITNSAIASTLGISRYYAAEIRRGRRRPHPRHWEKLAGLVGKIQLNR